MSQAASEPAPSNGDASAVTALAEQLAEDMVRRWRAGEYPRVEDYLKRHPELRAHPEAAIELVYEEICQREAHGRRVRPSDFLRRFPQWGAQLEVLLDCHRLLESERAAVRFPETGQELGGFRLLAELGQGAEGRVFLASEPCLADRRVVLKVTPSDGGEHLSLARLQHTHIAPLYSVVEDAGRGVRALVMPYFGGATLARVLDELRARPAEQRHGTDLLAALDRADPAHESGAAQAEAATATPLAVQSSARPYLAQVDYAKAVCWMGICLADALQYAHDHGLVHLDIKPSNILLAGDGTPMLLDFHLAHEPIAAGGSPPQWLGGTPGYMAPEQREALTAVRGGKPVPTAVDGRADVYALGVVLHEALGGGLPDPDTSGPRLGAPNALVSVGLEDIIAKCLAPIPADRYAAPAALSADLRRHVDDLPLRGVRNRSYRERWRKWRRLNGHTLRVYGLVGLLLLVALSPAIYNWHAINEVANRARQDMDAGRRLRQESRPADAIQRFQQASAGAASLEWLTVWTLGRFDPASGVVEQAGTEIEAAQAELDAERAVHAAQNLHIVADELRFQSGADSLGPTELDQLLAQCAELWKMRDQILDRLARRLPSADQARMKQDLLDLAILWAAQRVRQAHRPGESLDHEEILRMLDEAEARFGSSPVLEHERAIHAAAIGADQVAAAARRRALDMPVRTSWEHYALGRSYLRDGDLSAADAEFQRSLLLEPQGLWPNYYHGVCAYRLRHYEDAIRALSVCVGAAPRSAGCLYNLGLAYAANGRPDRARAALDEALKISPQLGAAALERGILSYRERRYGEASADFERALAQGVDPARVHYQLARTAEAQGDRSRAVEHLRRALSNNPGFPEARDLYNRLNSRETGEKKRQSAPVSEPLSRSTQ
jgi:serine/threonine protein kinase/Tfp pilus assembly protein PilF